MGAKCGNLCNKIKKKELHEEKEKDITFENHKSSLDFIFRKLERDYNLLKYFQLHEYVLLLTYFHVEPKADPFKKHGEVEKKENKQEMSAEEFNIFLENKILKNYLLASLMNDKEEEILLFKAYAKLLFESLIESEKDHWRIKNPNMKLKKGHIKSVKKLYVISMGLLFCSSSNIAKVEMLYSLFSNENNQFERSEEFENFLFYLFITPSTCSFRALKGVAERYPKKLEEISAADYTQKSDALEISDIIRLKDIFLRNFFKGAGTVSKKDYEEKFRSENFGWIFNPNGIRLFLENNNDIKE